MLLNYKEYGQGEPIIILHGLLGMLDNWHSFAKVLSQEYWVISVDQRNHGKSFHSEQFDSSLLSEDLYTFLDEMHIPKCHLMGHSMGGKTVMQFAHDYPDIVDKCIVVDMAPKAYPGGHEAIFNALLGIDISSVTNRSEVEEQLMAKLDDRSVVLFLMKNLSRNPEGSYRWKANVASLYDNYASILQNISTDYAIETPSLFIKGSKSSYIKEQASDQISDHFSDARIEVIPDAGHWVHADQPQLLLESVRQFLLA